MINQDKIKIMTKMALNDKYHTLQDKKITEYYLEDYVYLSNFKTRMLVLAFLLLSIMMHLLLRVNSGMNIPTTIGEIALKYVIPYGSLVIVVLVIYTFISTRFARRKYQQAMQRMKIYNELSLALEPFEKEEGDKYGTKRKRTRHERKDNSVL